MRHWYFSTIHATNVWLQGITRTYLNKLYSKTFQDCFRHSTQACGNLFDFGFVIRSSCIYVYMASWKSVKGKVLAQFLGQISNFRVLGQKLLKRHCIDIIVLTQLQYCFHIVTALLLLWNFLISIETYLTTYCNITTTVC